MQLVIYMIKCHSNFHYMLLFFCPPSLACVAKLLNFYMFVGFSVGCFHVTFCVIIPTALSYQFCSFLLNLSRSCNPIHVRIHLVTSISSRIIKNPPQKTQWPSSIGSLTFPCLNTTSSMLDEWCPTSRRMMIISCSVVSPYFSHPIILV